MKIHPIVLEKPEMESFRSISFADGLREEPDTQFVQIDTFQQVIDLLGQAAETLVQQDIQYFLNDAQVVQKELHDFMKNTQIVTCYLREKINIALALMWIIFLTVFHIYLHLFKNQWLSDVLEQYNVPHERLMVVSLILTVINIITQFIRIKRRPKMNRYEQLNDNFKKNVMIKAETLEEILYAGKSYLDD